MLKYKVSVTRYFEAENDIDAVVQYFNIIQSYKESLYSGRAELVTMPEIEVKIVGYCD